jgi:hypothetical protein
MDLRDPGVRAVTKNVKNVSRFGNIQLQKGFPMRANDSSVGRAAGQFHTTPWAAVMSSADGPSQSALLTLCDALIAAQGRPKP